MKNKHTHTHPFLGGNQEDDSLSLVLWNTNANFPVSHLIAAESDNAKDADIKVSHKIAGKERIEGSKSMQPFPDMEALSPFTQWLMSLKPSALAGSSQFEHRDSSRSDQFAQQITTKSVETTQKKKKKKKKKKKEARLKEEGAHSELPILDQGIVSDTLAELIASQGHIEDAIAMYRKLVNLHPEKTAFYMQRISELRLGKA